MIIFKVLDLGKCDLLTILFILGSDEKQNTA